MSIEEESAWIHNQLLAASVIPPQVAEMEVIKEKKIDKDDIGRVLTMMHVQKLDVRNIFVVVFFIKFLDYVSESYTSLSSMHFCWRHAWLLILSLFIASASFYCHVPERVMR